MRKYDIINELIRRRGLRSYLEICTPTTGGSFSEVERGTLVRRDRLMYRCPRDFADGDTITFRSTTEDIAGIVDQVRRSGLRYDLIFVDAWHTLPCAARDLDAALSLLTDDGFLVVHDCSPPNVNMATSEHSGACWHGVTYAAFLDLVAAHPELGYYTVDADVGCGIIRKSAAPNPASTRRDTAMLGEWIARAPGMGERERFEFFDIHRERLLNLVSVREFLNREDITLSGAFRLKAAARLLWSWFKILLPTCIRGRLRRRILTAISSGAPRNAL
ncbi:MAG TPA: class I SAM-dependent methyltransferase [Stellaceae bacterium]|nr:class I SAM-dependent methyltransferase [Stellaceae bacterium]